MEPTRRINPTQPWIAPAVGIGLVGGGIAMMAGMSSAYAPLVCGAVMSPILGLGWWRTSRGRPKP
jgi:hypothetical protein